MKYRLVIHENAIEDIRRNATWWKYHHSTWQAQKWFDATFEKLHTLEFLPESHPLAVENDAFAYEIRNMLLGTGAVKNYRAIFTIQGDAIHVLAVHRTTQEFLNPDDFPSNL